MLIVRPDFETPRLLREARQKWVPGTWRVGEETSARHGAARVCAEGSNLEKRDGSRVRAQKRPFEITITCDNHTSLLSEHALRHAAARAASESRRTHFHKSL